VEVEVFQHFNVSDLHGERRNKLLGLDTCSSNYQKWHQCLLKIWCLR